MTKRITRRRVAAGVVAIGATLVVGYVAGHLTHGPVNTWLYKRAIQKRTAKFLNRPAPVFESTTLEGRTWRLQDQAGKIVVIDFMASWCGPCVGSYPLLRKVYDDHRTGSDVVVVGIALDEDRGALEEHLRLYDIPWATLYEPGAGWANAVARLYEIRGIPSIWIINQEGEVAAIDVWGEQVPKVVEGLLHEEAMEVNGRGHRLE